MSGLVMVNSSNAWLYKAIIADPDCSVPSTRWYWSPGRTARGTHTSTTLTAVVNSLCLLTSWCCASNGSVTHRTGSYFCIWHTHLYHTDGSGELFVLADQLVLCFQWVCHTQNRKLFLHL